MSDVVRRDRAGPHVMTDRGLRPVGDDHLLRECAVIEERRLDARLQELARQRLAVDGETPVRALCAGKEIASDPDTGLCSSLRAPNAGQLLLGLPSPPVVEEPLVDGQLDAVRSQRIADAEREAPRDGRRFDVRGPARREPPARRPLDGRRPRCGESRRRRTPRSGAPRGPVPSPSTRIASMELIATMRRSSISA